MSEDHGAQQIKHSVSTQSRTTLHGLPRSRTRAIQIVWFTVAALIFILFLMGVPHSFRSALDISPETRASLTDLGLSPRFPAYFLLGTDLFTILAFGGVALLIVLRRSDDWMAMFVAMLLLTLGMVYSSPVYDTPAPLWLIGCLIALGEILQVLFVYLFPDGRWIPGVTRWLVPVLVVWRPAMWIALYLPTYRASVQTAETYGHVEQSTIDIVLFLILLVGGIGSQVYRYRRISTAAQRQQVKWLLFGIGLAVTVVGTYVLVFNALELFPTDSSALLIRLAGRLVRQVALFAVPITLAIAVQRYRLWDIDFLINRSLLYGAMTLLLGLVFVGTVLLFQELLALATDVEQSPLALAGSGLVVGALFTPTRRMLQAFIDRRFYGIQVDYRDSALRAQAAWRPNPPVGSIGPRIGAYDIIEPLGRGGMAEVYRGRHISLDRDVAIKVLPRTLAEQEDFRTRFEREAQAVASLQHPNIVQVYDFGEADGAYYMVMEIIKGPDLGAYLSQHGKLPLAEAQLLVDGIASALDYAHAQGLVHRDVKPSNVMLKPVTVAGSGASSVQQQPVLTDFGIVKIRGAGTRLTNTGMVGTFDYIAPEQIRDSKDVDGRADIYSLGVLTYQLLTGRTPFSASNPAALLLAHLNQPPPDPRHVQPDLPAGTAQALLQALHKDPAARFATAGDFARALC